MPSSRKISILLAAFLLPLLCPAQQSEPADSLVRLLSADILQNIEIRGVTWRKVIGHPARFLHNDTYLMCDTALWNVDERVIDAKCHVQILQDQTALTSDKMIYLIDQDLAQFRGSLVQLADKDNNTLRTKNLDYNTKDSVATFRDGGAMRDKDGQVIESREGIYDSKAGTFEFVEDVNMFTDSVFVKTSYLKYENATSVANFGAQTYAWQDGNMLAADAGWYNREKELFFFRRGVHFMSDKQEGWCDTLYVERLTMNARMLGNAQITDSTRNVSALAGKMEYVDSTSHLTMVREPAVIARTNEDGKIDTTYVSSDSLVYFTYPKCDVPSVELKLSEARLKSVLTDPVSEYRKSAAEAAAKEAAKAAEEDPNNPETARRNAEKAAAARNRQAEDRKQQRPSEQKEAALPEEDGTDEPAPAADIADSAALAEKARLDSLANRDTSKIGFLEAVGRVRMFRGGMQMYSDSLRYSDLDSIACLYQRPMIWNENGAHQYNSDSIYIFVRNNAMDRASLMSNAFIHIQEDTAHYDQIKSTEMTAFFEKGGKLSRFDALGGASALFYLEENDVLATVNKSEAKMLSASFKSGNIQKIYYYDAPKSDAYPVVQLSRDEMRLKGFDWHPEKRPATPGDVTKRTPRALERGFFSSVPRAKFKQTDKYFPGYMNDVYRHIAIRDSMKIVRELQAKENERIRDSIALADSLFRVDSLARVDSLYRADSLFKADSIAKLKAIEKAVQDSIAKANAKVEVKDTVATAPKEEQLDPKQQRDSLKAEKAKAREEARKAREKAREDKWAEKDKEDARKAAAKAELKRQKMHKEKLKVLLQMRKEEEREAALLDRYTRKYAKQKAKKAAASAKKPEKRKRHPSKEEPLPENASLPDKEGDDVQDSL